MCSLSPETGGQLLDEMVGLRAPGPHVDAAGAGERVRLRRDGPQQRVALAEVVAAEAEQRVVVLGGCRPGVALERSAAELEAETFEPTASGDPVEQGPSSGEVVGHAPGTPHVDPSPAPHDLAANADDQPVADVQQEHHRQDEAPVVATEAVEPVEHGVPEVLELVEQVVHRSSFGWCCRGGVRMAPCHGC